MNSPLKYGKFTAKGGFFLTLSALVMAFNFKINLVFWHNSKKKNTTTVVHTHKHSDLYVHLNMCMLKPLE